MNARTADPSRKPVPRPALSGRGSRAVTHGGASPTVTRAADSSRAAHRGNALLEFVLTLPILFFLTGLTIYMSFGMLSKQKTLVDARRKLWQSAGRPEPRGTGEELARLCGDIQRRTLAHTTNRDAHDYWGRIRDNLPGRHEAHAKRSFADKVTGRMWTFIRKTTRAGHWRDTSPWHYHHLDAWKIARDGPLREIFQAFQQHLEMARFAPHFEPTRDDIMNRWWHGEPYEDPSTP